MKNKNCPICDKNMLSFERYPNMICHECEELAKLSSTRSAARRKDHFTAGDFLHFFHTIR